MTSRVPPGVMAAFDEAARVALLGPSWGPNPQVGAVILDGAGAVVGVGWHRGAGTAHAEIAALDDAASRGVDVRGCTAVVTLEPCNHTGRTGPCAQALIDAGIANVYFAAADPNQNASGGAQSLNAAGVGATLIEHQSAREVTRRWRNAMSLGRPHVIAKWAQTLDGYIAATDGSSFWITGEEARAHAHDVRASVDAILVGTGTVRADDPQLSARVDHNPHAHQPLRVVMGLSSTAGARVWNDSNAIELATRNPREALESLWERDVRTVVVEGGSGVLSAFFEAGLVDEIHAYVAPLVLGEGVKALTALGIDTMDSALRLPRSTWTVLGNDALLHAHLTEGN